MTAYRNDSDAREHLLEHYEHENKQLVGENTTLREEVAELKKDNNRLEIIGRELASAANKDVRPIPPLPIDLPAIIRDVENIRHSRRYLLWLVLLAFVVNGLLKALLHV